MNSDWEDLHLRVPDDIDLDGVSPTGFFEDIRMLQLQVIDSIMLRIRWFWHSVISIGQSFSFFSLFSFSFLLAPFYLLYSAWEHCCHFFQTMGGWVQALFHPSRYLIQRGMDNRTKEEIVADAGYPYELHNVTTEDGYIITLERLPRPESTKALYFQHGLIDSGFTWLASGSSTSLAMAAYDKGYDVFLGNFRGNEPTRHIEPDIPGHRYWDYTINDHG